MRIFSFALVSALAFAQEQDMQQESSEPAAEEIDYDADWTAEVQWADLTAVDNNKSKKFTTSGDTQPQWTGLPSSITVKTGETGEKTVHLSMRTGWDLQWEDSKNPKCCSGSYGAIGWAWQNADGNWETATQGAKRGDALTFEDLQQGMSSDVSSPDLSREGVAAWGSPVDTPVAAWTVVRTGSDLQKGKKTQIAGLAVEASRPMTNDGITSTISFQNTMSYQVCGAGYLNRQGEVGASEVGCAEFMFNMPVKPEPVVEEVVEEEEMFASKLTASAFAIAALFALNF